MSHVTKEDSDYDLLTIRYSCFENAVLSNIEMQTVSYLSLSNYPMVHKCLYIHFISYRYLLAKTGTC